jgi:3-oxoacyl-(acyl-carrier-protein) synthase
MSRLALVAVESLGVDFEAWPRNRIGICLAVRAGSLTTDVEFWNGRDAVGGPSPTLFAYTLPSSAMGEIAIRYRITGPNLCLVGSDAALLAEARDCLRREEADACICVACDVVSPAAAEMIRGAAAATACALFLQRGGAGLHVLREIDRDMKLLCDKISSQKSACPK